MPLLIDGYNLLYATGILGPRLGQGSLHSSRLALLNFLVDSLEPEALPRATIVFDASDAPRGLPRIVDYRGIEVRFASKHASADELIEKLIEADSAPRRLTVVSSDHRIQRAARRRRAKAVDSDVWYAELLRLRQRREQSAAATSGRPAVPLLEEDVNYWIRQFGGEAALRDFLDREAGRGASSESASSGHTGRTRPIRQSKPTNGSKQAKRPKKKPGKRRRRRDKPMSDKPPVADENLDNPFPPGYGDDLLGELY